MKYKRRASSCDRKNESHKKSAKNESDVADLGKVVVDMMALSSAPKVELDVFSGNILEFEYFKANFKELVENKVIDQRGRLARLLKYTSGDAKELIKGCVHEESETCYVMTGLWSCLSKNTVIHMRPLVRISGSCVIGYPFIKVTLKGTRVCIDFFLSVSHSNVEGL